MALADALLARRRIRNHRCGCHALHHQLRPTRFPGGVKLGFRCEMGKVREDNRSDQPCETPVPHRAALATGLSGVRTEQPALAGAGFAGHEQPLPPEHVREPVESP